MYQRFLTLFVLSFVLLPSAQAQCQPEWDARFAYPGTANPTSTLTAFDDGGGAALFAGGTFSMAGGVAAPSIARWSGVNWSDLQGGANGFVDTTIVFDDGSGPALYAGGSFTSMGGAGANRIARWNGTRWSALGGGVAGEVDALASFDDGNGTALYAAVKISASPTLSSVMRWDGVAWTAVGGSFAGRISALAPFDDGNGARLYAGGFFSAAGGNNADNIARWNGTSWEAVGGGTDDEVMSLYVFDDGSGAALYAGGAFDVAGGNNAHAIARWNGTSWSDVESAQATNFAFVFSMTTFDDGSGSALYACGQFSSLGGVAANGIARWDGASWSALAQGIVGFVADIEVFDDGSGDALYVVGEFTEAGGVFADRIARWNGNAWSALGQGTNGQLNALASCAIGGSASLFAAGHFDSAGSTGAAGIARWDGSAWSALGSGFPFDGVKALQGFDDGNGMALYAGGEFASAGGVSATGIARWNGAAWSALAGGVAGASASVEALAVFDDGNGAALFAGGSFTSVGGTAANSIARWNGSSWSALAGGITGSFARVEALAVFDDGFGPALFAAGSFSAAGGTPTASIARWNGVSWSSMPGLALGFNALSVFDDGTGAALYAGGIFNSVGGVSARNVARWNGVAWSALGLGVEGSAEALAVFDDGSGSALYVGGSFAQAGGVQARRIARWDGASWSALGSGIGAVSPNGITVRALAVFDDGADGAADLYVGGVFLNAGGFGAGSIAQWHGCANEPLAFCFGDGLDARVTTACPCANFGAAGHGCGNSVNTGGALLSATGTISPDAIELTISDVPPGVATIFLQGDALLSAGVVFGDGVRCAGGQLTRMGLKNDGDLDGSTSFGPGSGDAQVSVAGNVVAGNTYAYQTYYRNPNASWCPPATFNISSGVKIVWR